MNTASRQNIKPQRLGCEKTVAGESPHAAYSAEKPKARPRSKLSGCHATRNAQRKTPAVRTDWGKWDRAQAPASGVASAQQPPVSLVKHFAAVTRITAPV